MKKIGLFLIAALVALSFMGCPTQPSEDWVSYTFGKGLTVDAASPSTASAGVTVASTATSNAYSTYTITITNLWGNVGDTFNVQGSLIGESTVADLGDHWDPASAFVAGGTVSATGELTVTFIGKAPSWADGSSSNPNSQADGAAFQICKAGSWDKIFTTEGAGNFYVLNSTGKNITMTVDMAGL